MVNNIFERLGLPSGHRPSHKVVQFVKHYKDVSMRSIHYPQMVTKKEDGVFAAVIFSNRMVEIFNRTGKRMTNTEGLEAELAIKATGTQYDNVLVLCELTNDNCSLEVLSGIVNPDRVNPLSDEQMTLRDGMSLKAFDMITLPEFAEGKSERTAMSRYNTMLEFVDQIDYPTLDYIEAHIVDTLSEVSRILEAHMNLDHEGIVMKPIDGTWVAGHKGFRAMKMVSACQYDLVVVDLEDGVGKREGMVANLYLQWRKYGEPDGELVKIKADLAGHTDETRIDWWVNPENIIGKIVRVRALKIGSKGGLRLAKVHDIRHDKTVADF